MDNVTSAPTASSSFVFVCVVETIDAIVISGDTPLTGTVAAEIIAAFAVEDDDILDAVTPLIGSDASNDTVVTSNVLGALLGKVLGCREG